MPKREPQPPKLAEQFLCKFIREDLEEEVLGDLEERFYRSLENKSVYRSKVNYWFETLNYLRPFAFKRSQLIKYIPIDMYRNYFKIAGRNIFRNKMFSSINIFSLAIGIAACLIIFLFIKDELSFDSFHTKKDNIYRLCELQTFEGTNPQNVPITWPKMGYELPDYFPEVKNYTRFLSQGEGLWSIDDRKLFVEKQAFVDSTFLEIFDFELLAGNKEDALKEPNSILVTEQVAYDFFSTIDVVGKTLLSDGESFQVTGLLKNVPENSHLQFDMLISLSTIGVGRPDFNSQTGANFMNTYVVLHDQVNVAAMESKFPDYLTFLTEDEDINQSYKLFLQRLGEVHLASMDIEHDYHNYRKFNGTYIDAFILTAIFILIIACVNFMNLTTARSTSRAKEVGVRKSIGATRLQLVYQFTFESVLMSCISLIIAMLLALTFLPLLNTLVSRELSLLTILGDPILIGLIVIGSIILGLITGLYPSLHLSAFNPIEALKGAVKQGKKSFFSGSLVIVQFSLALAMIVCTLVVFEQLMFMGTKDIGFNKDHVLLVKMDGSANDKYRLMKEQLEKESGILGVTASGQRLGSNFHQWGFKAKKDTAIVDISPSNVFVDYNYLEVYGIKLKSGRGFSEKFAKDDGLSFVINESFAKELGYEDPIGQSVGHEWYPDDSLGNIIGVTEDFNFNSLHYKVNTLSMVVHSEWGFSEMSVKLDGHNITTGISQVERVWNDHVLDFPFRSEFLEEHFEEVYASDQQMSRVITMMAVLSILIGCMGLFGLASMAIERRIKEIGIRKILGASTSQLILLLSRNFAMLVSIAFLIAIPMTYIYLEEWLNNFAFRIAISPLVFLYAGLLTFVIAMVTISFHTLKATTANPIDALRDE